MLKGSHYPFLQEDIVISNSNSEPAKTAEPTYQPTFKELCQKPVWMLAFGFGSGLAPKGPGTAGTLAAIPFYYLMQPLPLWIYVAILVVTSLVGIYLCDRCSKEMGVHDHGGIVWDEMVGYWLTMLLAPAGWQWALLGFILFRIFDIFKPWPISWLDKKVHGGFGIMIDDILAGIFALLCLQAVVYFVA